MDILIASTFRALPEATPLDMPTQSLRESPPRAPRPASAPRGMGWRRLLVQILSATVLMCAFLWWLAGDTARWIEMGGWQRAQWMSLLVAGGGAIYFGTLWLLGMRPADLRMRSVAGAGGTSDGTGPRSS